MAGDFLFVNKFIYGGTTPRTIPFTNIRLPWFRVPAFRDVERGDVIVFEFPGQREEVRRLSSCSTSSAPSPFPATPFR